MTYFQRMHSVIYRQKFVKEKQEGTFLKDLIEGKTAPLYNIKKKKPLIRNFFFVFFVAFQSRHSNWMARLGNKFCVQ